MDRTPGRGQLHLPLAIGEAGPIGLAEAIDAVNTAHALHIAFQLALRRR
jgi:hypothetical protein